MQINDQIRFYADMAEDKGDECAEVMRALAGFMERSFSPELVQPILEMRMVSAEMTLRTPVQLILTLEQAASVAGPHGTE